MQCSNTVNESMDFFMNVIPSDASLDSSINLSPCKTSPLVIYKSKTRPFMIPSLLQ